MHQKKGVLIYPIPTNDLLYLKNLSHNINLIEITNAEGKIILSQKIKSIESAIDVSSLTSGIYFIILSDSRKTPDTYKIIIQH